MAGAGYTPAQIDALTMFDVRDIFERWKEYPPVNEAMQTQEQYLKIIARALGVKFQEPSAREENKTMPVDANMKAMMEAQRAAIMKAHGGNIVPMLKRA